MTVLAIDFETANREASSPCAVGLAFIEGSEIVRREYALIRPRELRFEAGNIRVHGIRPHDVIDEPEFPEVFARFAADLPGAVVLAHNASFDLKVLRETLAVYGMAQPAFASLCTLGLSRRFWPDSPNHKLSTMAARFGVGFQHHHAGEDAMACARIALEGVAMSGARDVVHLAEMTGLRKPVAAFRARASGGIADRAMAARIRPALRPVDAPSRFTVSGSRGTPYAVLLAKTGSGRWSLTCSCPGSRFRRQCRHVTDLEAGDLTRLLPASDDEMRRLEAFLMGKLASAA